MSRPLTPLLQNAPPGYTMPSQVYLLESTRELKALMTIIRDSNTGRGDFIFYADRIIRLLVEEALNHLPFKSCTVETPTGATYDGLSFQGEAMEQGLRDCCRSVRIGKILIQRQEDTSDRILFYAKLPQDIAERFCLLLDPMLATGGSAIKAIEVLLQHGVAEDKIIFVNLLCVPEGLSNVLQKFPKIRIVTAEIDAKLDKDHFISPGLGDFGCIYFGTGK